MMMLGHFVCVGVFDRSCENNFAVFRTWILWIRTGTLKKWEKGLKNLWNQICLIFHGVYDLHVLGEILDRFSPIAKNKAPPPAFPYKFLEKFFLEKPLKNLTKYQRSFNKNPTFQDRTNPLSREGLIYLFIFCINCVWKRFFWFRLTSLSRRKFLFTGKFIIRPLV